MYYAGIKTRVTANTPVVFVDAVQDGVDVIRTCRVLC